MPPLKPSPLKVITTDYTIFSSLMFIFLGAVVIIFNTRDRLFTGLMIAAIVIALVVVYVRFTRIMAIINDNQMEDAVVTSVYYHRGMARIHFNFTYHGDNYRTDLSVLSSRASKGLIPGSNIHVLVDSSQPKKALIVELFSADQTENQVQID
jgi:hypothetical protein